MTVAIATMLGMIAACLLTLLLRDGLTFPRLQRENYRGASVATAGGLVSVFASLLVLAVVAVSRQAGGGPSLFGARPRLVAIAFVAFAMLGFLDDVLGAGDARGFRGHLRALAGGQITTGMLKLVGGVAAAWIVADQPGESSLRVIVGIGVIALSANLCNLLDRAPARALKCAALAWLPLVGAALIATRGSGQLEIDNRSALVVASVCVGSCFGLLPFDAAERLMIGDTGANALGAVMGTVVVLTQSWTVQICALLVVAALNLLSEIVSFSSLIQRVRLLDWLDRFATRRS